MGCWQVREGLKLAYTVRNAFRDLDESESDIIIPDNSCGPIGNSSIHRRACGQAPKRKSGPRLEHVGKSK